MNDPKGTYRTARQRWPYRGPRFTVGPTTDVYYMTPEVLELLDANEEGLIFQTDDEFLIGVKGIREKCWVQPCGKAKRHYDYDRAGLTYYVELPESSDGTALFAVFKLVGAEHVYVGRSS